MLRRVAIPLCVLFSLVACRGSERGEHNKEPAPPNEPSKVEQDTASLNDEGQGSANSQDILPEDEFVKRIVALNAHITVLKGADFFADYRAGLKTAAGSDGALGAQAFVMFQMAIDGFLERPVLVKGVDPARWETVMKVAEFVTQGAATLEWKERDKPAPALIGQALAETLKLKVGDPLKLLPAARDGIAAGPATMKAQEVQVVGLFDMSFPNYDESLVILPLSAGQAIYGQGDKVMGIEVRVDDAQSARLVAKSLQKKLGDGFRAIDWCELNHAIFTDLCAPKEPIRGTRDAHKAQCDSGQAESCSLLGQMFEFGQGGPRDLQSAGQVYDKACQAKNAAGCTRLGLLALFGRGRGVDLSQARGLFDKACKLDSGRACGELAAMVETGQGGPQEPARATSLYDKACSAGEARACIFASKALFEGGKRKEAQELLEKACDADSDQACETLGAYLELESGAKERSIKVLAKAERLFRKNCELGHAYACAWVRARQL